MNEIDNVIDFSTLWPEVIHSEFKFEVTSAYQSKMLNGTDRLRINDTNLLGVEAHGQHLDMPVGRVDENGSEDHRWMRLNIIPN